MHEVPYIKTTGKMARYADAHDMRKARDDPSNSPIELRPNHEFYAVMTLDHSVRGRSAAGFEFTDQHGEKYYMFLSEMEEMFKTAKIEQGKVEGYWIAVKRGCNCGIKLVRQ